MRAMFGGGHPVTAVGDPDQNIYAWRGRVAVEPVRLPDRLPEGRRHARRAAAAVHELPIGGAHPARGRHDHLAAPAGPASRPRQAARARSARTARARSRVTSHRDELTEARAIADRIVACSCSAEPASRVAEIAVLCRTSRLFFLLQQTFAEREIPAEIVGLAGLLRTPEVVEVLAYARAANDAMASVALARILMGPRYRVGFKDLALVAGVGEGQELRLARRGRRRRGDAVPVRRGARAPRRGRGPLRRGPRAARGVPRRALGAAGRGPPPGGRVPGRGDPAHRHRRRARGRRRPRRAPPSARATSPRSSTRCTRSSRSRASSPCGRSSTTSTRSRRSRRRSGSPCSPSESDSVKVMTIHQAKGLEFDHVFVPGVAAGLMPSKRIQQNPAERGYSLDFELRGDAAILPSFDGVLSHFKRDLQAQEVIEERRTMYVALTRARRSLHVSASNWYGENVRAKGPSEFFAELAEWGTTDGEAERGDRAVERPSGDVEPEQNPMLGYRESLVRDWPGPARPDDADAAFPDGWRRTAVGGDRGRRRADRARRRARRRRPRGVRAPHGRPAPARRAPARARGGRGRSRAPSARPRRSARAT